MNGILGDVGRRSGTMQTKVIQIGFSGFFFLRQDNITQETV